MKTKLTLFVAVLAALFWGGCSSLEPNYDNPIVAALETKKHKEERLAKEKVEADKKRAEQEAQRKREEKEKNEKLAAALRDSEIGKWRSDRNGAYSAAFGIVKRFEEKSLYTNSNISNLSGRYMNAYKWMMVALLSAKNDKERNAILMMERKLKPWVKETSHQLEANNHRDQLLRLASQFNDKPWKGFCDSIIKNGLLPPKP